MNPSQPLADTPELQALAALTGIRPVKLAAACELLKPEVYDPDGPSIDGLVAKIRRRLAMTERT